MSSKKIGRNDPCPCGSGKKYKHCCSQKGNTVSDDNQFNSISGSIMQDVQEQDFSSMEELQSFVESKIRQQNRACKDDFHGLSSEQMYDFLYHPFDSPNTLNFHLPQDNLPHAAVLTLFLSMAEGIGENGIKPTAKGNLPRKICIVAAQIYNTKHGHQQRWHRGSVNKEDDFYELHATRIIAEVAGLIRTYKGKFILSKKAKGLLAKQKYNEIYFILFQTAALKFNWGYGDGYPECLIVQQGFAFSLYLLFRYGNTKKPQSFYEDAFLQAFPAALDDPEFIDDELVDSERSFRGCYTFRTMERFAEFFGLVNIKLDKSEPYSYDVEITKQPLLDEIVEFPFLFAGADDSIRH